MLRRLSVSAHTNSTVMSCTLTVSAWVCYKQSGVSCNFLYPVTVFFASFPYFLGDGEIAPTFVKNWSLVEFVCMALAAKLPLEPLQRSCIGAQFAPSTTLASVGRTVSPAKTEKPIQTPFRLNTPVGLSNNVGYYLAAEIVRGKGQFCLRLRGAYFDLCTVTKIPHEIYF